MGAQMNKRWLAVALSAFVGFAATSSQGPQVNRVMREKLGRAQMILEGVVTSDWVGLETNSRELEQLTNDPRWMVLKYPEYAQQSAAFVRAVQDLRRAAAQRDLEKTPQAYVAVTLKCVECHRYLARARLAR
jgi:hypothetical protein